MCCGLNALGFLQQDMTKITPLALTITTALFLTSQALAAQDQLFLKNGDRLSGEISGYTAATVTIDTAYGTFDVPVETIGGVASPVYEMTDFQTAAVEPIVLPSLSNEVTDIVEPETLNAITPAAGLKNPDAETGLWGAKWGGKLNVGGELKDGNSDGKNILIDAQTTANWNDVHRLKLGADYEWEKENGIKVTDERQADAAYDYFFADRWFWNNAVMWEQDTITNLDRRVQASTGLGYQFYDTDDVSLEVTFGPGYQNEKYEDQDAEDSLTANWALGYEQSFHDDLFRLYHDHDLTAPTDDFAAWLFESDSGVRVPLKMGIVASGEIEFDWTNEPAMGEQEDDTTYALKLGYEW